jgi:hypothetical protein
VSDIGCSIGIGNLRPFLAVPSITGMGDIEKILNLRSLIFFYLSFCSDISSNNVDYLNSVQKLSRLLERNQLLNNALMTKSF